MRYRVELYYDHITREVYTVDAASEEEAKVKAVKGDGEFQYSKITSGELVHDVTTVEREEVTDGY